MCLPRGARRRSESSHAESHAAGVTQQMSNGCKCKTCPKVVPVCMQAFSGPHQMCDMKMELTQEKDACEAQLENKTTGRYVVCVCSVSLLPASPLICLIPTQHNERSRQQGCLDVSPQLHRLALFLSEVPKA